MNISTAEPRVAIRLAATDDEILRCYPVMRQLRDHLCEPDFLRRVRRQMQTGYELAYLVSSNRVRAVAGFRLIENLATGRILYVDDLVTDEDARSAGFGGRLFDWLVDRAREDGCQALELDSGVQRFAAHRFYLTKRMVISSHHFRLALAPRPSRSAEAPAASGSDDSPRDHPDL